MLPEISRKELKKAGLLDRVNRRLGGVRRAKEIFANNHKIVSITPCPILVPTYNMTVSPSHNYALSAGIIVKNSQARRPEDGPEKEYLLRSKDISEAFEKIRIADFIATLNQTPREKEFGIVRFHADIYRSNDTDKTIRLVTDFAKSMLYSPKYGIVETTPEWAKRGKR
jgi:hypothetical protein